MAVISYATTLVALVEDRLRVPSSNRNSSTSRLSDIATASHLESSRSFLAATLTLLSGGFQLEVALSVNLGLSACKHIFRRHIADRTVQANPSAFSARTVRAHEFGDASAEQVFFTEKARLLSRALESFEFCLFLPAHLLL